MGQRPTECQSWSVGGCLRDGCFVLEIVLGLQFHWCVVSREATEASVTAEQRKKELLSRQHTGEAFGPHCWAARMGSLRKCQVWRPPWMWTLTVGLWKITS